MSNEQNPNSSLNINNNGTSILVQEKYLVQNATSISTTSGTIYTETTGKQTNNIKNDDYVILADNGNINLTSTLKDINLTTPAGNITLTAGDSSMTISSSGNTTIEGTEIEIGNSETSNIDLVSDLNITLTTDAITGIATDDIIFKSTDGEIILDTSPSTGNNAITIDNSGNVIVNGDTTTYGYQFEVNVENVSTDDTNKNGISINNIGHNDISPEIRTVYTNTAGSNKTINSLGIYSDNDPGNQYRTYTGYQYGNQIITISGNEFNANDIGRTITFEDDNRSSLITNLGKIILPTDNTFASSTVTITAGGVYTGTTDKIYMIKNDTTTTFKWSDDGGVSWQGEYIPVSYAVGQRYPLNNGVYITFSSAAGHVVNDYWVIQAKITAVVNSNIIINGSVTNDGSSGTVVTGVTDNTVNTTTSTLGAPVFSNITGNVAISRLQEFKTSTNGLVGYVGTSTNNDLVLQTAGEPRFTITADGSLGVGQDTIDARIQTISNFNKSTLVNGNILNSNVIADNGSAVIGENSNLAGNILNFQQNPVATELRTGGYIIAYESQQNTTTEKFDIVADAFTANGDKLGSSFKINVDTTYNQSHPHLAKSGNSTSDNYMAVWTSNIGGTGYGVAAQVLSNNNEVGNENNDITVATSGYTPRVAGLSNGNYIITYCVKNGSTNKYEIRYQILNSTATSVIVSETTIANSASLHYIYPYVAALDKNDAVRPGGFVISYLKQVYTSDNRYQSVFKLFDSDGSNASSEIGITTTAVVDPGDVGANTDLSLSDSLLSVESLPSGLASNNNGGFLVCYQTNYSASVAYSDVVDSGVRNVLSVSGNGNGDFQIGWLQTLMKMLL